MQKSSQHDRTKYTSDVTDLTFFLLLLGAEALVVVVLTWSAGSDSGTGWSVGVLMLCWWTADIACENASKNVWISWKNWKTMTVCHSLFAIKHRRKNLLLCRICVYQKAQNSSNLTLGFVHGSISHRSETKRKTLVLRLHMHMPRFENQYWEQSNLGYQIKSCYD